MKYEFRNHELNLFPAEQDARKTIGDFLDQYLQSRRNRYILIRDHRILLNGKAVQKEDEVIGTNTITLLLEAEEPDWVPADTACEVIYQDQFLLIVHKEAGCIIHGEPDDRRCLNAQVARWMLDHDVHAAVRPIHRLDRDTEGLVIYSLISFFQPWFDQQLEEKKIRRHYKAICYGRAAVGDRMTIRAAIGRDRHRAGAYRISDSGKPAVTAAECLAVRRPYVLMGCELETGRTHQIRVHLSSRELPIVNDSLYGKASRDFTKMGLWADAVEFRNPLTRKKHRISDRTVEAFSYFERTGNR